MIIADSALCFNAIVLGVAGNLGGNRVFFYIINRIIHGCLEI